MANLVSVRASERRYYERRAPEYDDWYLGEGLFAERERPGWEEELARLVEIVADLPAGRILDVACGTGFRTVHLPGEVTGVDASPGMLAVARARCPGARFARSDAFSLPFEDSAFDLVFTSHFYGHLRRGDRERFLAEARRVAPEVVVGDSALRPRGPREEEQERNLNDGSSHYVYKRYFAPNELADELVAGEILFAGKWFVVVRS